MTKSTMIIDHAARGVRTSYPLKPDVLHGFHEAVQNNQVTLAMEYLRFIVDEMLERVSNIPKNDDTQSEVLLQSRIAELETTVEALKASLAPSRKVTKKGAEEVSNDGDTE